MRIKGLAHNLRGEHPLEEKLRQLTLTTMAQQVETVTSQAATQNLSFPTALKRLADLELEARHGRAIERRFKLSRLPAQPTLDQFRFSRHNSLSQREYRSCAVLLLLDRDTQRVYRLHDFTKSHHLAPGPAYCVAGKVNSADKLYLIVESVRPDTKHDRCSTVPAPDEGAGENPVA